MRRLPLHCQNDFWWQPSASAFKLFPSNMSAWGFLISPGKDSEPASWMNASTHTTYPQHQTAAGCPSKVEPLGTETMSSPWFLVLEDSFSRPSARVERHSSRRSILISGARRGSLFRCRHFEIRVRLSVRLTSVDVWLKEGLYSCPDRPDWAQDLILSKLTPWSLEGSGFSSWKNGWLEADPLRPWERRGPKLWWCGLETRHNGYRWCGKEEGSKPSRGRQWSFNDQASVSCSLPSITSPLSVLSDCVHFLDRGLQRRRSGGWTIMHHAGV